MNHLNRPALSTAFVLAIFVLGLTGCATGPQLDQPAAPGIGPTLPPAFPPQDIVGRWGLAAYHKDEDRARTEQAAIAGVLRAEVTNDPLTATAAAGYIARRLDAHRDRCRRRW